MMCIGVCFLESNFVGTLWASWTSWKSISFARLGKFSFIICSDKFSISCSSSSPSGTSMIRMLKCLKLSQRFLSLSSFFWILVSSFCSDWMFVYSFCSKSLIWALVFFPLLLVLYIFFISLGIAFTSWLCSCSQSFLWVSWLPVFWTLHPTRQGNNLSIALSLSSFSGVLVCSFIWAIFLCLGASQWAFL